MSKSVQIVFSTTRCLEGVGSGGKCRAGISKCSRAVWIETISIKSIVTASDARTGSESRHIRHHTVCRSENHIPGIALHEEGVVAGRRVIYVDAIEIP